MVGRLAQPHKGLNIETDNLLKAVPSPKSNKKLKSILKREYNGKSKGVVKSDRWSSFYCH